MDGKRMLDIMNRQFNFLSYKYMYRYLITVFLLIVIFIPAGGRAGETACPELLKNERDLDKVYDLSKLVFIARISPRNEINPRIYNFKRFDPVLKGDVPEQGFITFSESCAPKIKDSIYLFMLNGLDEKIEGYNAIFFALPDGGPGFRWIADWIESKLHNQTGNSE